MTEKQKNIIIPIVLIGVVAGAYVYVKKLKAKPFSKLPKKQPTIKKEDKPAPAVEQQTFPLKVGSNNAYVKQLQDALGVGMDGKFGSKETLPALKDQTGFSQVVSYDDLQYICEGIFLIDNDFATKSQIFPILQNYTSFVEAWYNAANNGLSTFTYDGTLYNTKGAAQTFASENSLSIVPSESTSSNTDNTDNTDNADNTDNSSTNIFQSAINWMNNSILSIGGK